MHQARTESRAFIPSDLSFAHCQKYLEGLSDVPVRPDESYTFQPWSLQSGVRLMRRARDSDHAISSTWFDYATKLSTQYVGYRADSGALVKDPRAAVGATRTGGRYSGSKRSFGDIGRVPPAPASSVVAHPPPAVDLNPAGATSKPPGSLEAVIPTEDLRRLPNAVRVLRHRIDEAGLVGSLIESLSEWFRTRDNELYEAQRDVKEARVVSELANKRADEAVESFREATLTLREVRAERDRLRREVDAWRYYTPASAQRPTKRTSRAAERPDPYSTIPTGSLRASRTSRGHGGPGCCVIDPCGRNVRLP